MKAAVYAIALSLTAALSLSACQKERKAEADTGTAEATVKTEAPASVVPDAQLQAQAQQAATAASTPVDGSGPDVKFSLKWHNNVIWKSSEKPDTLIGSWDLVKVDVRQMLTSGSSTDLEQLVNAPIVHFEPGATVEMKVWDEDTVGSDDAGTIHLKLDELRPGENVLLPKQDKSCAIKRVVLAVIDRRTPVPELVNMISNR